MQIRTLSLAALAFVLFAGARAEAVDRWVCAAADSSCGGTPAHATISAAHTAAACGDRILIKNEAFTFASTVTLNKVCSAGTPLTFEGSLLGTTGPPAGTRLVPTSRLDGLTAVNGVPLVGNTNPTNMPTITGPSGGTAAFQFAAGSRGYVFKFMSFRTNGGAAGGFEAIIAIGTRTGQDLVSEEPREVIIDRCLFQGDPYVGQKVGVSTNGMDITIRESYFTGMNGVGQDTQAISGSNGSGPIAILNNWIEGGTENFILGGALQEERTYVTTTSGSTTTSIVVNPATFRSGHSFAVNVFGDANAMIGKEIAVQYDASTAVEYCHAFITAVNSGANTITVDVDPDTVGNQGCPGAPPTGMDVRWGVNYNDVTIERNVFTRLAEWQNPILSAPINVQATPSNAAGSLAAGTYYYKVAARNHDSYQGADITSIPSAEVSCTLDATGQCVLAWSAVSGATIYRVYGRSSGGQTIYFQVSAPTVTVTDTGAAGTAGTPPTSGTKWQLKNLLELKQAVDVTIQYNIFEYTYTTAAGNNYAITLKASICCEGGQFTRTADVYVGYNVIRHVYGPFAVTSQEEVGTGISQRSFELDSLTVEHNLVYDSGPGWGSASAWAVLFGYTGPTNFVFRKNTVVHRLHGAMAFGDSEVPFGGTNTITDNLFFHNTYGFDSNAPGTNFGILSIDAHIGSANFLNNVVTSSNYTYPTTTIRPDNATLQAAFVNYGGPNITDYALTTAHAYRTAGTSGGLIGADIAQLVINLSGVFEGQPANAPTILTTSLPNGTVGVPYVAVPISITGGTGTSTCSIATGSVPTGLTLSSACAWSGTPTAAGTFTFTVRATDTQAAFDDQALQIVISAPDPAVTITTAATLPDVVLNGPYLGLVFTATGGNGTYLWSQTSGTRPPGVQFDPNTGALTGPATQAGTFTWTMRVDSSATFATRTFTQTVGSVGPTGPVDFGRPWRVNIDDLGSFKTCTDSRVSGVATDLNPENEFIFERPVPGDMCVDENGRFNVITSTAPAIVVEPYAKQAEVPWTMVVTSAPETITADTTLGADAALVFSAAADTKYKGRCDISFTTGASEDFKWTWTFSGASPTLARVHKREVAGGATAFSGVITHNLADVPSEYAVTGTGTAGKIEMSIDLHATAAGTWTFQWAQNTSGAPNTIVEAGSYCEFMVIP
jgi:hypothetical protein